MSKAIELRLAAWLAGWSDWNVRHAPWVVLVFIAAAAGSLYFAVQELGINTDNSDMLDEVLPFRQTLQQYKTAFPQHANNLLLVIDGEGAYQAARQLTERLTTQIDSLQSVYWPGGGVFFETHALYYLQEKKLAELSRQLQQSAPLLSQLLRDPSATGLLQALLNRWVGLDGSWRLLVYARDDLGDINTLRRFVNEVSAHVSRVTDTPAISLASGEAAVKAFQQAFVTALVLISGLLLILLRSLRDTLLVLLPLLLAGLLTSAAGVILDIPFNFANIITLPLLLGIGVDNGIHMVSRARMAMPGDRNLLHTSTSRAVIISGLTTVASFGNLGFSAHPGTASMGQLLTVGVLLTMVCTLLVLPAILAKREVR